MNILPIQDPWILFSRNKSGGTFGKRPELRGAKTLYDALGRPLVIHQNEGELKTVVISLKEVLHELDNHYLQINETEAVVVMFRTHNTTADNDVVERA